ERGVAAEALHHGATAAAVERFAAGTAGDRVVAVAAVDDRRLGVGERAVDVRHEDRVVARAALDEDRREGRPVERAENRLAVEDFDLGGVTAEQAQRDGY